MRQGWGWGPRGGQGDPRCHLGRDPLKAGSRIVSHLAEDRWESEMSEHRSCATGLSMGESGWIPLDWFGLWPLMGHVGSYPWFSCC